jgi:GTPase-associated protein 1, N-terminal domain type 1
VALPSSPAVQQALHGYRDGHRILAASVSLDDADRRQMLTLSDSPDAKQIAPDAPLFNGYPLPSGEFFVLAMTWPASEIRRPGCVWTHSLLLAPETLEQPSLVSLLGSFRRPHGEESFSDYAHELNPSPAVGVPRWDCPEILATALWSLYDPPAPPVDLRSSIKGVDRHRFLLALWEQQWPALRATFSFAEAPRTARRLDSHLMDLQVTGSPQASSWEVGRGEAQPRSVTKPLDRTPKWCQALAADIVQVGEMRDFIWHFSSAVPPRRTSLWALASVWASLDGDKSAAGLTAALGVLAREFPEPEQAADLKRALLGSVRDPRLPRQIDETEALFALSEADLGDGVPLDGLDLRERAAQLLKRDRAAAVRIVESMSAGRVSRAGRAVLGAIGAALTDAQLHEWAKSRPAELALLAASATELLARPDLYLVVDPDALWPEIGKPYAARARRLVMLEAMLEADASEYAELALTDWSDGGELLLEAISRAEGSYNDPGLLASLKVQFVLDWLGENGPEPWVAAALPEAWKAKKLSRVPVREWNALLELGATLPEVPLVSLFVAACDPDSKLGSKRALSLFSELYRRFGKQKSLKRRARELLADRSAANSDDPWLDLAAAILAGGYVAGNWDATELLQLDSLEALNAVIRGDPSTTLLRDLVTALKKSPQLATEEQGNVIWDALMDTENPLTLKSALKAVGRKMLGI